MVWSVFGSFKNKIPNEKRSEKQALTLHIWMRVSNSKERKQVNWKLSEKSRTPTQVNKQRYAHLEQRDEMRVHVENCWKSRTKIDKWCEAQKIQTARAKKKMEKQRKKKARWSSDGQIFIFSSSVYICIQTKTYPRELFPLFYVFIAILFL